MIYPFPNIFPTVTVPESTTGASPRTQCHSHQAPAMVSAPHTARLSCDALSVKPQLQGNRQRGLIKASCPHQPPGNEEPGSFLPRSLPSIRLSPLGGRVSTCLPESSLLLKVIFPLVTSFLISHLHLQGSLEHPLWERKCSRVKLCA